MYTSTQNNPTHQRKERRERPDGPFEHVTNIRLGFSEPHSEKFWTIYRDEVGLALVGNGLGHEGLTATGRTVEEDTLTGGHTELFKLLRMLHGVLNELLEVTLWERVRKLLDACIFHLKTKQ